MAETKSEAMSPADVMGTNGNENVLLESGVSKSELEFSCVGGKSETDSLVVFGGLVLVAVDSVERFRNRPPSPLFGGGAVRGG